MAPDEPSFRRVPGSLLHHGRDAATSALTFVQAVVNGSGGVQGLKQVRAVAVSPDGAHLYTASRVDDAVAVFGRDATTGHLAFVELKRDGVGGVDGLNGAEWVAVSADGRFVYAAGDEDNSLAIFSRDAATGALTFIETFIDGTAGVDGLAGAQAIAVSPGSPHVYVAARLDSAVTVFQEACANGILDPEEQCDDGNRIDGDCCSATCTVEPAGAPCPDDGNLCTKDKCNGVGLCLHVNNTVPCDDGDFCTVNDQCENRECRGAPRDCSGATSDQCLEGVCDEATDTCVVQLRFDGAPCDDTDPCTLSDTCQAGLCTGGNPLVCAAMDQCHDAGTCDSLTGACSNPQLPDGSPCDDADLCTQTDACQAGICTGADPLVCTADQCHDAGACDPGTGQCSNPPVNEGQPCNDGDACTQTDTCQAGSCIGADPTICTGLDQCHDAGTCDPATGECFNPNAADGSPCDDGNLCTLTDTCEPGVCVGSDPVVCAPSDGCHLAGTCDPATGACSSPLAADGTSCDDGDLCTQTDACGAGVCIGTNTVVCTADDQCSASGVCDPATGQCSDPARSLMARRATTAACARSPTSARPACVSAWIQ